MHDFVRRWIIRGRRVPIIAVLALACAPHVAPFRRAATTVHPPAPTFVAQFDSLWTRFDAVYPSFDYKQVNWATQRALYRPRAERVRSQGELIALVCEMLEPLKDLHIWFTDPRGQSVPTFRPQHVANFDVGRWERALRDAGGYRTNFGTAAIECAHRILEALALDSDQRVGGYSHLVEDDFAGIGGALSELAMHPIARDAGQRRGQDKTGDALVL